MKCLVSDALDLLLVGGYLNNLSACLRQLRRKREKQQCTLIRLLCMRSMVLYLHRIDKRGPFLITKARSCQILPNSAKFPTSHALPMWFPASGSVAATSSAINPKRWCLASTSRLRRGTSYLIHSCSLRFTPDPLFRLKAFHQDSECIFANARCGKHVQASDLK